MSAVGFDTREDYFRLMTANGAVRVFRAAQRLGILDSLRSGPKTAVGIALDTGLSERPVAQLLVALERLGVLAHEVESWHLTSLMEILSGAYAALGDEYWGHLDQWLRTGEPCREMDVEDVYREQVQSLAWMLRPAAAEVAGRLRPHLDNDPRILDVGAGSGLWSLALGNEISGSTITLFDRPGVLEVARMFAAPFGGRVQFLPGDLRDLVPAKNAFDLIFLANVCHLLPLDECGRLFRRLSPGLAAAGMLVVIDVFPEASGAGASLYQLGLSLRTRHGMTHAAPDLLQCLHDAGLRGDPPEFIAAPPGTLAFLRATPVS